ncbi:hypothetical protein V2J09_022477 [Rumex salicifolius]
MPSEVTMASEENKNEVKEEVLERIFVRILRTDCIYNLLLFPSESSIWSTKKKQVVIHDPADAPADKLVERTENLSVSDGWSLHLFGELKRKKKPIMALEKACQHPSSVKSQLDGDRRRPDMRPPQLF